MPVTRPQWPHTIDDITKALDGVWGVVGAQCISGNLARLERSFSQPFTYTLIEYEGADENRPVREQTFTSNQKDEAVKQFAGLLGFTEN